MTYAVFTDVLKTYLPNPTQAPPLKPLTPKIVKSNLRTFCHKVTCYLSARKVTGDFVAESAQVGPDFIVQG